MPKSLKFKMDTLWAPWRINYIGRKKESKCIFCQVKKDSGGQGDHLIFKTAQSICLLNRYPYNNGHLMICPLKHTREISELNQSQILDLFSSLTRAKALLQKVLKPQGYNVGFNLGAAAGAGIKGHLHLHLVPRWFGDTNFMPSLSGTKVIGQSLESLATLLRKADGSNRRRLRS